MGVCNRCQMCAAPSHLSHATYGKGTLEGNLVLLDALDGSIRDRRLAVLEDGIDVDGLPGDGGLLRCVSAYLRRNPRQRRVSGSWRLTLAAAKMSLTATAISGPMPSPSIKLTV